MPAGPRTARSARSDRAGRRGHDVSRRQRRVAGTAAQGEPERGELYRSARRCRRAPGPRDRLVPIGPGGGVMMYLADSAELQELQLKGSQNGKNYIGPPGDAGGPQDREIVSFDGRTMVLRWMDPEVAGRYGTGVYVRCAAEGSGPRAAGRPPMQPPAQQR